MVGDIYFFHITQFQGEIIQLSGTYFRRRNPEVKDILRFFTGLGSSR
jgi:hypothetical protein